jgi:tetratricopeptide (TPR) repeat protein/DNA-binding winged helix-turn-helix (wHTH) protein
MVDAKIVIDEKIVGWRFGSFPFELYAQHRALMRGGVRVPLPDAELSMLILLASRSGQDVRKDDILSFCWPDLDVNEGTMSMALSRLREKLVDPVIETKWGYGLRMTCPIDPLGTMEQLQAIHLIALFTRADIERQTMPDAEWDRKYAPEIDKIRASLAWSLADPLRRHIAIDLLGATAQLFERLSLLVEARGYVDRILPLIDKDVPDASAARFFTYAGSLWRDANRLRALSFFQRAFVFCDKLNDDDNLATLLGKIGGTRVYLGQHDEAEDDLEEAVKKLSKTDRKKDLANALNDLGSLFAIQNHPTAAKDCFDRAIDIASSYNDIIRKYIIVLNLGEMEFNEGAPDRAQLRYEEADRGLESAPNAYRLRPLVNLATCHAVQGDFRETRFYALKALALSTDGDGFWRWIIWLDLAFLAAHYGKHAYAAQLLGALGQLCARSGEVRQKLSQQLHDRLMENLQENLSADSLQVWLSEGGRWTEARAMAYIESHILPAIPAETANDESK